jgi:hypothetical protein
VNRLKRLLMFPMLVLAALALTPSEVGAQRRAVRVARPRTVYVVRAGHYRPWFGYSPWYYSGWWGDPFWHGYGPYPRPYPYYWRYDNTGSARLDMEPRDAQVYVDGYFVGIVDEFDGRLQRLNVEAGEHEVQVYREGYRTYRQKVLFTRGHTVKITQVLQPLAPGDPAEPKPVPDPTRAREVYRSDREGPPPSRREQPGEFGTLSIRIDPADAQVFVDGEEWDRPEGEQRFSIDLPEGPHRLEVRREGHRTYERTVEIRRGRTLTLNVSLSPGE